jgi:ribonuclease BN (tRNA processing enzyme)
MICYFKILRFFVRFWKLVDSSDPVGYTVVAGPIFHRIPSFGFVIQEPDQPGPLDAAKATLAGLKPGPNFGLLKQGIPVKSEDGTVILPEDVLGPSIKGRKVILNFFLFRNQIYKEK